MKAGDYFGELGTVLCDGIRTATVTAEIDCAVLRITGTDFGEGAGFRWWGIPAGCRPPDRPSGPVAPMTFGRTRRAR